MVCTSPVRAYRAVMPDETGKRPLFFGSPGRRDVQDIMLPCQQCISCKLARSAEWALRCVHESRFWDDCCFVTVTYSNDNLPSFGSLLVKDHQDFMKRLRSRYGTRFKFFMCGEYGETTYRPHYHYILFGVRFSDMKLKFRNHRGEDVFTSELLDKVWKKGQCSLGAFSFDTAAYVARYCTTKINGAAAEMHYAIRDANGVWQQRLPEFMCCSKGIGSKFFDKFLSDLYPSDFCVINDHGRARVPRFYDKKLAVIDPALYDEIKHLRYVNSLVHADNNTRDRLKVRGELASLRLKQLKRSGV